MSIKSRVRQLGRVPLLGRLLFAILRLKLIAPPLFAQLKASLRWLLTSKEYTNFTYDLTPLNKAYLAAFIASVTDTKQADAMAFIEELEQDPDLRRHLQRLSQSGPDGPFSDPEIRYGKRAGWYALVRILKPAVVIETGVDKGLGSCVLTAALLRNHQEGHRGRYYGTDIQPRAGYFLQGPYASVGEILYGDSIESLRALEESIDMFINDSDHSAEYEEREYGVIEGKLSEGAVVIGDNAHVTSKLLEFAERTGRRFQYWQECPKGHWYGGGGIGVAYWDCQAQVTAA